MRLLNLVQESSFSFRLLCVCKVFDIEIYEDIIWDIISHSAYNYEKKQYIQSKLVLIPIPNHDDHEIFNSSNHYWLMQNIIQHHQYNDIQQPQFYLLFPILESYDELSLTASGMRSFFFSESVEHALQKIKEQSTDRRPMDMRPMSINRGSMVCYLVSFRRMKEMLVPFSLYSVFENKKLF